MEKKMVYKSLRIQDDLTNLTLSAAAEFFAKKAEDYPKEATVSVSTYHEYGDEYGCVEIDWKELESDDEFKKRIHEEKQRLAYRKAKYEQLKKEFGG